MQEVCYQKSGRFLAADRCGISVRFKLMPKGWIGAEGGNCFTVPVPVCTSAPRVGDGENTEGKNSTLLHAMKRAFIRCTVGLSSPNDCSPDNYISFIAIHAVAQYVSLLHPAPPLLLSRGKSMHEYLISFQFARSRLLSQMFISQQI